MICFLLGGAYLKVLWICGLPEEVRLHGTEKVITSVEGAAWSWIMGHLPPPPSVDLHILCPTPRMVELRIDFDYCGVHWHCFRQRRYELVFFWFRFLKSIRSFVKNLAPDVIHGWGGETGCGWLATWLSEKSVVSVQGLLLLFWHLSQVRSDAEHRIGLRTRLVRFIEKDTYKRAGKLLVESEASRKGLVQYYGRDASLISHPLRFPFLSGNLSGRADLSVNPIKFIFLGGLEDRKGAIDAVRAFAQIEDPRSSLLMIGDGGRKSDIVELIDKCQMQDRVYMRSSLSSNQIVKEFSAAQFFLLPSYGDTGPTALKEAMSCGLYPICYDNSGPHDLITHYGYGSLVTTGNQVELADEMKRCIQNVEACIEKGLKCAKRVREALSPSGIWRQLINVYVENSKQGDKP